MNQSQTLLNGSVIEYLPILMAIVEKKSVRNTAEYLQTTPRYINNKMNQLERLLNIKIVTTSRHGTCLTKDGQLFYDRVVADYQSLSDKILQHFNDEHNEHKELKIFLPAAVSVTFSQIILPKMLKLYPKLHINMTSYNAAFLDIYGYNIRQVIEHFDLIISYNLNNKFINIDDWTIKYCYKPERRLYCSKAFMDEHNLQESLENITDCRLIVKKSTDEEAGVIWLNHYNQGKISLKFNNTYKVENDIQKQNLIIQGVGIGLLEENKFFSERTDSLVPLYNSYSDKNLDPLYLLLKDPFNNVYANDIVQIINESIKL